MITKRIRQIGLILIVALVLLLIGGAIWVSTSTYDPDADALSSWEASTKGEGWYAFYPPAGPPSDVGVIFYTGGLVDSRAYAHMAAQLAQQAEVLVVVPDVPLNLVILNPNLADEVRADFPEVERWILGGHSLGAVGAAIYANSHPDIAGLFFWAGGGSETADLSDNPIPAISIYSDYDAIYTEAEMTASRPYNPPETEYIPIMGGLHSDFGNYGIQKGDNAPVLVKESVQTEIVEATRDFILNNKER